MRRCVMMLAVAVLALGCGSGGGNERKNDPGPPIQMNPSGPGPMQPPGEGGRPDFQPRCKTKRSDNSTGRR